MFNLDMVLVPSLRCGQSYRDPRTEARIGTMRTSEVTHYQGCGRPMIYVQTYRCRQCGRWMHGGCLDRHFGEEKEDGSQGLPGQTSIPDSAGGQEEPSDDTPAG